MKAHLEPYRILFPLGIFASVIGTVFWITFGFGLTSAYPGAFHPDLMISCFLAAFVSGFLMTAIPRFTQTFDAAPSEIAVAVALIVTSLTSSFFTNRIFVHLASLFLFFHLGSFAFRRFRQRKRPLPPYFVFVGLGLLMGILSSGLMILSDSSLSEPWVSQLGKLLFYQGIILSLIVGIGSQLIPAFLGWSALPMADQSRDQSLHAAKRARFGALSIGVLFLISFIVEARGFLAEGRTLRALAVTVVALLNWKIWKIPKRRSIHAYLIWVSAVSVTIGLWLPLRFPDAAIHAIHIVFIAGFGLMTLMVATRVILSHGGYGTFIEDKSKLLAAVGGLLVLASLTRAIAAIVPRAYLHHLAYAALTWNAAVVIWSILVLSKVVRPKR